MHIDITITLPDLYPLQFIKTVTGCNKKCRQSDGADTGDNEFLQDADIPTSRISIIIIALIKNF